MNSAGPDYAHILEVALTVLPIAIGFVWTVKSDTKVLRTRLDAVDKELAKMGDVLVRMAEQNGRIDRTDDRMVVVVNRLDELAKRFNELRDRK